MNKQRLRAGFCVCAGVQRCHYATESALTAEIGPTDDVDVVIELASYGDYSQLDEKLRVLGFSNDITSKVICRYKMQGIIVDFMPTDPNVLGFSNQWYPEGFATSVVYNLNANHQIKIFALPYFFATKWEAFLGRCKNNYRTCKDFEGLVLIGKNVDDYDEQIKNAPSHLESYLRDAFIEKLEDDDFEEGLYAHLAGGYGGVNAHYSKAKLRASMGLL